MSTENWKSQVLAPLLKVDDHSDQMCRALDLAHRNLDDAIGAKTFHPGKLIHPCHSIFVVNSQFALKELATYEDAWDKLSIAIGYEWLSQFANSANKYRVATWMDNNAISHSAVIAFLTKQENVAEYFRKLMTGQFPGLKVPDRWNDSPFEPLARHLIVGEKLPVDSPYRDLVQSDEPKDISQLLHEYWSVRWRLIDPGYKGRDAFRYQSFEWSPWAQWPTEILALAKHYNWSLETLPSPPDFLFPNFLNLPTDFRVRFDDLAQNVFDVLAANSSLAFPHLD